MDDSFFPNLRDYAISIFECGPKSVHGPSHWDGVDASARLIAQVTQADPLVVRFFAFLHDASRLHDGDDIEHGPRAANRLRELPDEFKVLNQEQLDLLTYAIHHHTDGDLSDNITIGACWDADRLDLWRVGIIPSDMYMSTETGREMARKGNPHCF